MFSTPNLSIFHSEYARWSAEGREPFWLERNGLYYITSAKVGKKLLG